MVGSVAERVSVFFSFLSVVALRLVRDGLPRRNLGGGAFFCFVSPRPVSPSRSGALAFGERVPDHLVSPRSRAPPSRRAKSAAVRNSGKAAAWPTTSASSNHLTNRRHACLVKLVGREPQQQARLAHAAVSYEEDLEEVVERGLVRRGSHCSCCWRGRGREGRVKEGIRILRSLPPAKKWETSSLSSPRLLLSRRSPPLLDFFLSWFLFLATRRYETENK